ncbi:NICE-3 predicted [Trinorchestia longiramus]|nr:NICE-3 predicted [Trinorchestia longiramus]
MEHEQRCDATNMTVVDAMKDFLVYAWNKRQGGALLAIIVSAICGKRKLHRHKEFSRKDPHVPGSETHKALRMEIERRVERVRDIKYDPLLLNPELLAPKNEQEQYFSRMKALDHLCYLERELCMLPGVTPRVQHETLRGFLVRLTQPSSTIGPTGGAVLRGIEASLLHQLCDLHAHARYHPQPFTRNHLTHTHALMLRVLSCARSVGRKQMGSEDPLRTVSDQDSAIDADPLELDQSDEETRLQQFTPQLQHQSTVSSQHGSQPLSYSKLQKPQAMSRHQEQQQLLYSRQKPMQAHKTSVQHEKILLWPKSSARQKPVAPQPSGDKAASAASVSTVSSDVASGVSASVAEADSQQPLPLLKSKAASELRAVVSKPRKTKKRPSHLRIYDEESPDC